jgi:hypothetical protein
VGFYMTDVDSKAAVKEFRIVVFNTDYTLESTGE